MKPLYILLLYSILLLPSSGHCKDVSGYVKIGMTEEKIAGTKTRKPSMRTEVYLSYDAIKTFGLSHNFYGKIDTWAALHRSKLIYRPYRAVYTVGYRVSAHNLFIGIEHYCSHAVEASWPKQVWEDNTWVGAVDMLYIGVKW